VTDLAFNPAELRGPHGEWMSNIRPRTPYPRGRAHWKKPPERRMGRPGEYMYRSQLPEYLPGTLKKGLKARHSAGMLPDDPDKAVYVTSDDKIWHADPRNGHPGTPEWDKEYGDGSHLKIDVSGLPLTEDRTYTNPKTGEKRAWMVTQDIAPSRVQRHVPGTEHGVTYDLPGNKYGDWAPPGAALAAAVGRQLDLAAPHDFPETI
jgi:hypothetical protein